MTSKGTEFTFSIKTLPVGKGRPRFTRAGFAYTPAKTRQAEKALKDGAMIAIAEAGLGQMFPIEKPHALAIELEFLFPVTKSWPKKKKALVTDENSQIEHISKPDIDNLIKAVLDAFNEVVYEDDSQITKLTALKRYSMLEPQIVVKISDYGGGNF